MNYDTITGEHCFFFEFKNIHLALVNQVLEPMEHLHNPSFHFILHGFRLISLSFSKLISAQAFAAVLGDGSVQAWGSCQYGGDCSAVQSQLKKVRSIHASHEAFAALLENGSVVTWGHPRYGGDSSSVSGFKDVQQIQATHGAFAAICGDGSVVAGSVWHLSCA